jgi:hypothetical protein
MAVTKINFRLDLLLMGLLVVQGISGIILLIGSNSATYLGTSVFEWRKLHGPIGISVVILLVIHLIICLKWLIDETKKRIRTSLFDSI